MLTYLILFYSPDVLEYEDGERRSVHSYNLALLVIGCHLYAVKTNFRIL